MTVFMVSFELGSGSSEFSDKEIEGGFVQCFVPTNDIREAIELAESALIEDGYAIELIEKVEIFNPEDWGREKDLLQIGKRVKKSGVLEYGPFDVFHSTYEQ